MLVWHSSGIIDNGGFEYLFVGEFPGDPDYHITAEAYKTAELWRGYEAFQEAFALFPGGKVPCDAAERLQHYQAANRSARDQLDRKLWQDGYTKLGKGNWPSSFGRTRRGWATSMRPSNAHQLGHGNLAALIALPLIPVPRDRRR